MSRTPLRGVFRVPFVSEEGFPVLVAIASDGRRICERLVYPFESEGEVLRETWDLLNEADPQQNVA